MRLSAGLFLAVFSCFGVEAQSIGNCAPTIVAGPQATDSGDGGPAAQARLSSVISIARDASGNLYLADLNNYRVRMITPDGVIHAFAGNGVRAYSGDGGSATTASLMSPAGLAVSPAGEVYISDNAANVVRKVSSDGTIRTIAGNGMGGFAGDGGPAASAMLSEPQGIAFDSAGNLYIADFNNDRIRKVDTRGVITTIAGGGNSDAIDNVQAISASLETPTTLAIDGSGTIYLATRFLFKITTDGVLHHIAGSDSNTLAADGSPALTSLFVGIRDPALDPNGNLLFTSQSNGGTAVWRLGADGNVHLHSTGPYGYGLLANADGSVIQGTFDSQVYSYAQAASTGTLVAGAPVRTSGDGGPATSATFTSVSGIAADKSGNVYVSDSAAGVIRKIAADGTISTFGGNGGHTRTPDDLPALQTYMNGPAALAVGPDGSLFYAETYGYDVRKIGADGKVTTAAGNGQLPGPNSFSIYGSKPVPATSIPVSGDSLAFDASGNLYIADSKSWVVWELTTDGNIHAVLGLRAAYKLYLAADPAGSIQIEIESPMFNQVQNASGLVIADLWPYIRSGGAFTIDGQGNYYTAALDREAVVKRGKDGRFQWLTPAPLAGTPDAYQSTPQFQFTAGLSMDAGGNIYAADTNERRVVRISNAASCTGSVFPVASANGPVNAADYQGPLVAPGELVTIFGQNLGPSTLAQPVIANGGFPPSAGSTQVFFDNIPAPIVYASAGQTAAMVPFEIAAHYSTRMQIVVNGLPSPSLIVRL